MKTLSLAIVLLSLCGCYSVKTVKLGSISSDRKSIEVPATGFSIPDIKRALVKDGWRIKVPNQNVIRVRADSANPSIDSGNGYDAAYRLAAHELVRGGQWLIGLNISVVDNKTNEEILNMYFDSNGLGGCYPDRVAEEIAVELKSIEK